MPKFSIPHCSAFYINNNSDDFFVLERAAQDTHTPLLLKLFLRPETALASLSGQPPYDDTALYPPPAVLLCDDQIDDVPCWEVVLRIRALLPASVLPIVILSGSTTRAAVERCYAAGATLFFHKNLSTHNAEVLVETLYHCLMARPQDFFPLRRLPEYEPVPPPAVHTLPHAARSSRVIRPVWVFRNPK